MSNFLCYLYFNQLLLWSVAEPWVDERYYKSSICSSISINSDTVGSVSSKSPPSTTDVRYGKENIEWTVSPFIFNALAPVGPTKTHALSRSLAKHDRNYFGNSSWDKIGYFSNGVRFITRYLVEKVRQELSIQ